jgi:hypothetical protein
MDVFGCLFDKRDQPVTSKEELLNLWRDDPRRLKEGDDREPDQSSLTHAVTQLRRKLQEFDSGMLIEAVSGHGYRFCGQVTEIRDGWLDYVQKVVTFYRQPPSGAYPYGCVEHAIPWRAKDDISSDEGLVERVRNQLLRQPVKLLLVGEYGTGKTKLSGAIANAVAESYPGNPPFGSIPVLIPLRHLSDFDHVNDFALELLQNLYGSNISQREFLDARRAGALSFVFDGLDEFLARRRETDAGFYLERLLLSFHNSALVVTSRPNVLDRLEGASHGFTLIHMGLLSIAEAQSYLENRGLGNFLRDIPSGTAKRLRDLIRRPLFLEMVSGTAEAFRGQSVRHLTELTLFEEYVKGWAEREVLQTSGPFARWSTRHVQGFLARAAYVMLVKGQDTIGEEDVHDLLRDYLPQGRGEHRLSELDRLARERLVLVPDFVPGERRFTFRHESLQGFFAAYYLYDWLKRTSRLPFERTDDMLTTLATRDRTDPAVVALAVLELALDDDAEWSV